MNEYRRECLRNPVIAASRRDVCEVYRSMRREGRGDLARMVYEKQRGALRSLSGRMYRTLQSDIRCGWGELIAEEGGR